MEFSIGSQSDVIFDNGRIWNLGYQFPYHIPFISYCFLETYSGKGDGEKMLQESRFRDSSQKVGRDIGEEDAMDNARVHIPISLSRMKTSREEFNDNLITMNRLYRGNNKGTYFFSADEDYELRFISRTHLGLEDVDKFNVEGVSLFSKGYLDFLYMEPKLEYTSAMMGQLAEILLENVD